MIVDYNINNLSGGVSQQQDELRFSSQVESMENFTIENTGEIVRRNGLKPLGSMDTVVTDNTKIHSYDRGDGLEKYGIVVDKNGIQVFDANVDGESITKYNVEYGTELQTELAYLNGGYKSDLGVKVLSQTNAKDVTDYIFLMNGIQYDSIEYLSAGDDYYIKTNDSIESSTSYYENIVADESFSFYDKLYIELSITGRFIYGYKYTFNTATLEEVVVDVNGIKDIYDSGSYFYVKLFDDASGVANEYFSSLQLLVTRLFDVPNINYNKDIDLMTVGDTTFMLNKKATILGDTIDDGDSFNRYVAMYWIKRSSGDSNNPYTYNVELGDEGGIYQTLSATSENSDSAVSSLLSQITQAGTPLAFSALGNRVFQITNPTSIPDTELRVKVFVKTDGKYIGDGISVEYQHGFKLEGSNDNSSWTTLSTYTTIGERYNSATQEYKVEKYTYYRISELSNYGDILIGNVLEVEGAEAVYNVRQAESVLIIARKDGNDFWFKSGDSWGDQASIGIKGATQKLTDLPPKLYGITEQEVGIIAITGTDKDNFNSYYVKWNGDSWVETHKIDTRFEIDKTTMPLKLTRQQYENGDIYFLCSHIDWDIRDKGDEDTNPTPSFVNNTISNMFFFKNRLCFTSNESVIMSEIGSYYNYFATTAMEVLDSDCIDVTIDSNEVSNIRYATLGAGSVTLWTDNGQFLLGGGEILSPATTRISQTSSYSINKNLKPIAIDNEVLFFNTTDNYLKMYSYNPSSLNSDTSTAEELTTHIPRYIPNTIKAIKASSLYNTVVMLDIDNTMYVYKYLVNAGKKVISGFYKWTFEVDIINIEILSDRIYVITEGDTSSLLYSMDFERNDTVVLDTENDNFTSSVVLSKFSMIGTQDSRVTRDVAYLKELKVNKTGNVDMTIYNKERNTNRVISSVLLNRKQYIGSINNNIQIELKSDGLYNSSIGVINVSMQYNKKSQNVKG